MFLAFRAGDFPWMLLVSLSTEVYPWASQPCIVSGLEFLFLNFIYRYIFLYVDTCTQQCVMLSSLQM